MTTQNTLTEKQAARMAAMEVENKLEILLTKLCGITPSIVSPNINPFAVFRPKTKEDYIRIITSLKPIGKNFELTFAGKDSIKTFSPYSIHYGGKNSTPNYMEVVVKFNHEACPIWVKMPNKVMNAKFSVSTMQGDHKGFGNYETVYTLKSNAGTTVQKYYGENKTMYAATEKEAETLNDFITKF